MTFVLYLAIKLENGYFKTLQTWVGMFLSHTIHFYCQILLPVGLGCAKQERRRIWRIGAILKKIENTQNYFPDV